jgi:hypothetical protein
VACARTRRASGRASSTIITDRKLDPSIPMVYLHRRGRSPRMPNDVGQSLPSDAIHRGSGLARNRGRIVRQFQLHRDTGGAYRFDKIGKIGQTWGRPNEGGAQLRRLIIT